MSLMPDFELGLWNAWIFMLPLLLIWLSFIVFNKEKMEQPSLSRKEKSARMSGFVYDVYSLYVRARARKERPSLQDSTFRSITITQLISDPFFKF